MPETDDYGSYALEYLSEFGIKPVTPPIRASDLYDAYNDPYFYYLTRRLALIPAFYCPSDTLARGTWTHKYLEYIAEPVERRNALYSAAIHQRQSEIREICRVIGWEAEKLQNALDKVSLDANCAYAWLLALDAVRSPEMPEGFFQLVTPINGVRTLAVEYRAVMEYEKTKLVSTLDRIDYNPADNSITIMDYKTSDARPSVRAATCPLSFQYLLYRHQIEHKLATGELQREFDLPLNTWFKEFHHVIIQKPTIVFGQKDRPYLYTSEGKRSGVSGRCTPINGQWLTVTTSAGTDTKFPLTNEEEAIKTLHAETGKKPEREYDGEPSPQLFAKRCLEWYTGTGEYADRRNDPDFETPINVSILSGPLDTRERTWYNDHLEYIYRLATRRPYPLNFPATGHGMTSRGGKLTQYAPFYRLPVAQWPEYILRNHFIQNPNLIDSGDEG